MQFGSIFLYIYIPRIVTIALSAASVTKVKDFAALFTSMKDLNCSDDLTNQFFVSLSQDLNNSTIYDLHVALFFSVALLILDFTTCCGSLFNRYVENHPDRFNFNYFKTQTTSPTIKERMPEKTDLKDEVGLRNVQIEMQNSPP